MRVGIDPGHGGDDTGASVEGVDEATVNWDVAALLYETLLKLRWADPRILRSRDVDPTQEERGDCGRTLGVDAVISLHCDLMRNNPEVWGMRCYHLPDDVGGDRLAHDISRATPRALYNRASRAKVVRAAKDLPWLRHVRGVLEPHRPTPVVLVEMGFLSNTGDRTALQTPVIRRGIVTACIAGILSLASPTRRVVLEKPGPRVEVVPEGLVNDV